MLVVPCQGNASPDEVEQARNKVSSTRIFFTRTQLSFSLTLLLENQKIMFVNWVAAREASRLLHFCWLFGSVSNPRYDVWMNSRCLWTKIRKAEQLLCFVNMLQNIQKPRFEKLTLRIHFPTNSYLPFSLFFWHQLDYQKVKKLWEKDLEIFSNISHSKSRFEVVNQPTEAIEQFNFSDTYSISVHSKILHKNVRPLHCTLMFTGYAAVYSLELISSA